MKKFVLLLLVISSVQLFAQEDFNFQFDYARFKYDSTASYLEIYYEVNQKDLTFYEQDGKGYVNCIVNLHLTDVKSDETILDKDWNVINEVSKEVYDNTDQKLVGLIGLVVPEGDYALRVKGTDAVNEAKGKVLTERLEILPFINPEGAISDIQVASNIITDGANEKSLFYKNTLEVIPNPSDLFTNAAPVLFYYAEIYNSDDPERNDKMKIDKLLYNSSGKLLYTKSKYITRSSSSLVEIGLINLKKYPTDTYSLVISLVDTSTSKALISSKKFFLYNPDVIDTSRKAAAASSYLSSEFGVLTEEECDKHFDYVKYLSTSAEKEQYGKLTTIESKREYLFNFWRLRDSNPFTPVNEDKEEFMQRLEFCNDNFRTMQREGYRTDRGRVYLLYGEPDQRDLFPSESDMKPHERWFYNSIESGVFFIFGDINGFGDYELLTSNKIGELRDDQWQRRIIQN